MRRLLPGTLAFLVLTGLLLVLPVYSPATPEPEPVAASVEEVALGSVSAPAPDAEVRPEATQRVVGVADTTPRLIVRRPDVPRFSLVGVTWAYDEAVTDTLIQVRAKGEDGVWGSWTQVGIEEATQDADADSGATTRGGTAPLWTGPSTGVEVELVTRSGAQPTDVKLDLIDPGASAADSALGAPEIQDTADAAEGMPPVYSRAQWGADESKRTWAPQYAGTIKAATVHHTADSNGYTAEQVPAIMRSIYQYHAVSLGWGDIGYNVIVDKFGRRWEGRYGGLASTVIGAHAGGFNTYTFGVSMLGNYDVVDTTPAMIDAVVAIIAWKFSLYGIDPEGTTTLTSSGGGTSKYAAGVKVTLPTVFAHRDVGSTACPGRYAFARMGQIRTRVAGAVVDMTQIKKRYDSDAALRTLLGPIVTQPTLTDDGIGAFAHYQNGSLFYSAASGVRMVRGPIRDLWTSTGRENGILRYPTSDEAATSDGTGKYSRFQGGSIYWTSATGARAMLGPIQDLWLSTGAEGGLLGYPTTSVSTTSEKTGQYAHFEGGSIFWSAATGARAMLGPIRDLWMSTGAERGALGYPTRSVSTAPDGVGQYAEFQGGSIYWSPTTGARAMLGPIQDLWRSTGAQGGALGYPTTSVSTAADGVGQYARFEHGSIYWSPDTGARALLGPIEAAWVADGAEQGPLGYPTTSVSTAADGVGQYAHFQNGSIYWTQATGARAVMGSVRQLWNSTGAERGPLGYPTLSVAPTADGEGEYATFQNGSIYSREATGTRALLGPIDDFWTAGGAETGPLGYPTTSVSTAPDQVGQFAHFEHGSVYWTQASGAHSVAGPVQTLWNATRAQAGALGYPVSDVAPTSDGVGEFGRFQGGSIYWSPDTGARALLGAIQTLWNSTGGIGGPLGYPTTSVSTTADGKGQYARFEGGSIYWTPATGARAMLGPVETLWRSTGAERGLLGYPTSSVSTMPDGVGQYARFEGGAIYWSPSTGARALLGAIQTLWNNTGGAGGVLGYPTTSVSTTADKKGQYARFQGGSIYWTPATGARAMLGPVEALWLANGAERGVLGYPTTSVSTSGDGVGKYARFQGGSIYWSPSTNAHMVRGAFLTAWTGTGAERGTLGYPKTEAYAVNGGSRQDFQRGYITVSTATGKATVVRR